MRLRQRIFVYVDKMIQKYIEVAYNRLFVRIFFLIFLFLDSFFLLKSVRFLLVLFNFFRLFSDILHRGDLLLQA